MQQIEHEKRVSRLLRGERHTSDLERLFADLRFSSSGNGVVREVGDFAAHRAERNKGVVMSRAADMQTSAAAWFRQMSGEVPSLAEARQTMKANLRIVPEARIKEALGMTISQAQSHYLQAEKHLESGRKPKKRQGEAFNFLAATFQWKTAFTSDDLMEDFSCILLEGGALAEESREDFQRCRPFVTSYALTVMHGSKILLSDGAVAPLRMKVREETQTLRIKANIPVADVGKPVSCAVCVFETDLDARIYSRYLPDSSDYESYTPLEIGADGSIIGIE